MNATVLFKIDHTHSADSKELIGVFTNRVALLTATKGIICDQISELMDFETSAESENYQTYIFDFLFEKNQTQGLPDYELIIEEITTNQIL